MGIYYYYIKILVIKISLYAKLKKDFIGAGSGAAVLAVGSSISLDNSTERRTELHWIGAMV
jgi:hypothetical protein